MKLDLFNIDDFVRVNNCPQVTSPIFWNYDTTPNSEGLFSYELFGTSDEERKNIFGYIDLKGHYIHPLIWLMIQKRMGALGDVMNGIKYAVIADGKIKYVDEDFKGAETGIDFLYEHYEEINWIDAIEEAEIDSIDKKTRLKFIKSLKKDEFFITKWLVLPPFYRAESSTNRSMGDNINKLYKELLTRVNGMNLGFSFDIFGAETKLRIQNILKDIYLSTCSPISGKNLIFEKGKQEGELKGTSKNSMIRKHLLGKNVDWSASNVITSPHNSNANTPDEKPVPYGYSRFPMSTLVSMFQPFYVQYISDMLADYLNEFRAEYANKIKKIDIGQFNADNVEKLLKKYIKAPNSRNDQIKIEFTGTDGNDYTISLALYEFKTKEDAVANKNFLARPMTLTDIIYIASKATLSDKHVYVTRFPIANFQNIYPAKIKVLTTTKTRKLYVRFFGINKTEIAYFDDYPTMPKFNTAAMKYDGEDIDSNLYDVMICGNAYLATIGGDYDGDMLYMRAVFTQEANVEAEKLIWAKTNMLNAKGEVSRGLAEIEKECVIGLFELTKVIE